MNHFSTFSGMSLIEVEPGTVITHGTEQLTVTDEQAVIRGRCIYATKTLMDALKKDFPAIQETP